MIWEIDNKHSSFKLVCPWETIEEKVDEFIEDIKKF